MIVLTSLVFPRIKFILGTPPCGAGTLIKHSFCMKLIINCLKTEYGPRLFLDRVTQRVRIKVLGHGSVSRFTSPHSVWLVRKAALCGRDFGIDVYGGFEAVYISGTPQ